MIVVLEPTLKMYGNLQKKNTRKHTSGKRISRYAAFSYRTNPTSISDHPDDIDWKAGGTLALWTIWDKAIPSLTHTHAHNVTSQPDHSSSIVPGINIANSPQNRGRRARSAAAPADSHPLPAHKTCRRHYERKGRPRHPCCGWGVGGDGTSHTTRYCRLILIFTILRFQPPGVHKHTEIKYARSLGFVYWWAFSKNYLPFCPTRLIIIHLWPAPNTNRQSFE